ncbi:uncharacterized protein LOC131217629 [Magnolia sinica]|uniref:uncharacterized protein LOC131217629 n=1 Tax=Magnolia sinica TaxID=86752 RepID=UPI00265A2A28|nr:uncharacterized protein LOC131217629 [Magnolia sinica]
MVSYEVLYGRPCRASNCWAEVGGKCLIGPDVVQEAAEKVEIIRKRLQAAQSRQKSYADNRRRDLKFTVGDHVFLKVSPMKGLMRFGTKGKLAPRFIGLFEILERIGAVAYRLALPPQLANVHNVFHVSMLRKYKRDDSHVIEWQDLDLQENTSYVEKPVRILDRKEDVLRTKTVHLVKVLWNHHEIDKAFWEQEREIREKYSHLFEQ